MEDSSTYNGKYKWKNTSMSFEEIIKRRGIKEKKIAEILMFTQRGWAVRKKDLKNMRVEDILILSQFLGMAPEEILNAFRKSIEIQEEQKIDDTLE